MKAVLAIVALVVSTTAFAKTTPIQNAADVNCDAAQAKLARNGNLDLYIGNAGVNHPTFFTTDKSFCDKKTESLETVYIATKDENNCRLSACVAK